MESDFGADRVWQVKFRLGEVNRPGLYSVDPTMTIYDVVATAGGATRDAKSTGTRLIG